MPLYDYQCTKCNHLFEAMQKLADPVLTKCPKCHEESLKRLITCGGFILKGSGWFDSGYQKIPEEKTTNSEE